MYQKLSLLMVNDLEADYRESSISKNIVRLIFTQILEGRFRVGVIRRDFRTLPPKTVSILFDLCLCFLGSSWVVLGYHKDVNFFSFLVIAHHSITSVQVPIGFESSFPLFLLFGFRYVLLFKKFA